MKSGTESSTFPTGTGPYAYSGEGGAHLAPAITFEQVDQAISRHLGELLKKKPADLAANRYQKFRKMGAAAPQKESQ